MVGRKSMVANTHQMELASHSSSGFYMRPQEMIEVFL